LVFISNKKAPRKKVIVVKDEDEEGEEVGKKIHCV
jgi:5S rRNA maturation endonuclease (ribonuclease M5)